jgi:hypothetical protein
MPSPSSLSYSEPAPHIPFHPILIHQLDNRTTTTEKTENSHRTALHCTALTTRERNGGVDCSLAMALDTCAFQRE